MWSSLLAVGAAALAVANAGDPCCQGKCTVSGEHKYWSITKGEDGLLLCGETCLSSAKYYMVHMLEWNLTLSNSTDSPCSRSGYSQYYMTVNHSFHVTTVTSDLYKPPADLRFEEGVMAGLGYSDGADCFKDAGEVAEEVWKIGQELRTNSTIARAKALAELAAESKEIVETFEQCSTATGDIKKYTELVKNLKDPRYYTLQNALTLALNVADDRNMLKTFVEDLKTKQDYAAGKELILTVLDVIERPGIPLENNGTAAIQIASGIAVGFGEEIKIQCFQDLSVEVPLVIAGVMECLTGVGMISGLESLFAGVEGIVPTFEHCYEDRQKIMSLLKEFGDFKNPHSLARLIEQNMVKHSIDISIGVAQAVLAAKGQEWYRLGEEVGKILSEIAVNNTLSHSQIVI